MCSTTHTKVPSLITNSPILTLERLWQLQVSESPSETLLLGCLSSQGEQKKAVCPVTSQSHFREEYMRLSYKGNL